MKTMLRNEEAIDGFERLCRTLIAADAHVHYHLLLVKAQCQELVRVQHYVDRAEAARRVTQESSQQRQDSARAQSTSVRDSISDAIRRARRIRGAESTVSKHDEEQGEAAEIDGTKGEAKTISRGLFDILEVARCNQELSVDAPQIAAPQSTNEGDQVVVRSKSMRTDYPRRMKALMQQLEDATPPDGRVPMFRCQFHRKLSERLCIPMPDVAQGTSIQCVERAVVQVSFPMQAERLQQAYRALAEYTQIRTDPDSVGVQRALQSPTLSSVFTVHCRVREVRKVLKQLQIETRAMAERIPCQPLLSAETVRHRDAMLKRLRRQQSPGQQSSSIAGQVLGRLLESDAKSWLAPYQDLLGKLDTAWQADREEPSIASSNGKRVFYSDTLREAVLAESSRVILTSFQQMFCDRSRAPTAADRQHMLQLVRAIDSLVVQKGRMQRSAIA